MSLKHCLIVGALVASTAAHSAPVEKVIDYTIDGAAFRGYAYYDDAVKTARPLVVLVPNWLGATEANRKQAAEIAADKYVVFVADMYGANQLPADQKAAGAAVGALYGNRPLLRSRILAAKQTALESSASEKLPVDEESVAAIGFCFGGATVIELARSGDDLDAVVSFHGNLSLQAPAENQPIATRILALHGDSDPYVPLEQVEAFEAEMRQTQADWQLVSFGGAVHSFTDPDANVPGQAMYDPKVAKRAFKMMDDFLAEAFAAP